MSLIIQITNHLKIPTWQAIQLFLNCRIPQVFPDNTAGLETIMHFHLKPVKEFWDAKKALHNRYQLNLKTGIWSFKIQAHTHVQAASYLQAHGGWDQQSLGHPPTRTAKVPAALAADYAAKRIAHLPSGSGWSCTGWGPLLSPGIALVRKWVPATQTSSIWSLSDQPATQKREGEDQ